MDTKVNYDNEIARRISWIDNVRAIAIILVVMGHTGIDDASVIVNYIHDWIYEFHMPLFFLLSGFSFSIVAARGGTKQCGSRYVT